MLCFCACTNFAPTTGMRENCLLCTTSKKKDFQNEQFIASYNITTMACQHNEKLDLVERQKFSRQKIGTAEKHFWKQWQNFFKYCCGKIQGIAQFGAQNIEDKDNN